MAGSTIKLGENTEGPVVNTYFEQTDEIISQKELRAVTARLHEGETRLHALLDTVIDGVISIDKLGIIENANRATLKLFGYAREELVGKNISILTAGEHTKHHDQYLRNYIKTGKSSIIGKGQELTATKKDGTVFPIKLVVAEMNISGQRMFSGIIRDLSDRKLAEQQIRDAEAKLVSAIEALPGGFFLFDENDKLLMYNQLYRGTYDDSTDMIVPGSSFESILRDGLEKGQFFEAIGWEEEWFVQRLAQHHKESSIIEQQLDDEKWITVLESKTKEGYTIGFSMDITDKKKAELELIKAKEQAESANQAQTNFLAMMSHEIRTPLNGVLGIMDMLNDDELTDTQSNLVKTGHESGQTLLRIINDILDYSKIEAGHLDINEIDFDMELLVKSVVDIVSMHALKKGLNINIKNVGDEERYFKGDAEKIRQILINLAGNAVKFTDEGFVTIRIKITRNDGSANITFYVVDSGIGIPEEKRHTLFDRFTTVSPSYQRQGTGTGLGLAISKQLVEAMGGKIGMKSNDLGGSTFWASLDLELSDAKAIAGNTNQAFITTKAPIKPNGQKYRLLMAEDNPTNALVARAMLEKAGYRIIVVGNGKEAVKAVQSFDYDLILMDIGMPEMDGTEATAIIRKLSSSASSIPIIALTAHVIKNEQMANMLEGMDDHIAKPINKPELLSTIAIWLTGKKRREPYIEPLVSVQTVDSEETPNPSLEPNAVVPPEIEENEESISNGDDDCFGNEPILNEQSLIELSEDTDPEMLPEFVSVFLASSRDKYNNILAAADQENLKDLENHAHALCGASATFGALQLRSLVLKIESACKQQDKKTATGLARRIMDIGDKTENALNAYIASG